MIRLIQKWIINTFGFSKTETNGSLILIGLVLLVAILPRWFINKQNTDEGSTQHDKVKLLEWYNSIEFAKNKDFDNAQVASTPPKTTLNLKGFDPNSIGIKDLEAMGLPGKVANNIVNYRDAGGSFSIKSDLQKIYGMDEILYDHLEPFILLPDNHTVKTEVFDEEKSEVAAPESVIEAKPIYINTASAEELEGIRGIGPTLSKRIIKYRDLLGGFHSRNQLNEVYGLNEEVIHEINQRTTLDSAFSTIDINAADLDDLSSHPYIDYTIARAIINYKTVHGSFKEKSGLKKIKIVSDSLYKKLSPYISVRP